MMQPGFAGAPGEARVEGQTLVAANGMQLPPVCFKCGQSQGIVWRDQKYQYVPPWAWYFLGWLGVLVFGKRSRFDLPVCPPCNAAWKKATLLFALSWLPGLLLVFVGTGVWSAMDDGTVGGIVSLLGFVAMVAGLVVFGIMRLKKVVRSVKIDKTHTWLRGVHPAALQAAAGGGMPQPYPQQAPPGGGYDYPQP